MKPKSDLFDLVQALTKTEKRHVSLFLESGLYAGNSFSRKLFRAVMKQKTFDDNSLRKQSGNLSPARFSVEKHKLFGLIIESLDLLYRDSTPERRIFRSRRTAQMLIQKGLREAGRKQLEKTKQIATQYQFWPALLLLATQENMEARTASVTDKYFDAETFHKRDAKLLKTLEEELVLHTLFTELINIQKKFGSDIKAARNSLQKLMRHPLLKPHHKLSSFGAQMSRLDIRALFWSMQENHHRAAEVFASQAMLIENHPEHIDLNYLRYCNALSNQLMHTVILRRYDEVPELVSKTTKANNGMLRYFSFDLRYNEFVGIRLYELIACRDQADTANGPRLLAQMESTFAHYRPLLRDTLVIGFLYVFGTYHFYLGNHKKALHHLNDLINSTSPETGINFQCMARLVKLLLHYTMKHDDLIPSMALSVKRFLQNHRKLKLPEKMLLHFCQQRGNGVPETQALRETEPIIRRYTPSTWSYGNWCTFEAEAWLAHLNGPKNLAENIRLISTGKTKAKTGIKKQKTDSAKP